MSVWNISFSGLKTCRYLLKISYLGTKYNGAQRQSRRIYGEDYGKEDGTVQCAIENALDRVLVPVFGARLGLSSRTDTGVHCINGYAHVDLTHPFPSTIYKPNFITTAVNRALALKNHEITLIETQLVPYLFSCQANAKWRTYVYRLAVINNSKFSFSTFETDYATLQSHVRAFLPISQINRCHIVSSIDFNLTQKYLDMLRGEHDFASFSTKSTDDTEAKSTIKNIEKLELRRCYPLSAYELENSDYSQIEFYELYIRSKSFLYNQVRRMVGAMVDIGHGRITLKDVETMLTTPHHRPSSLSPMVPPYGLYLVEVGYNEEDMIIHEDNFWKSSVPVFQPDNFRLKEGECEVVQ